MKQNLYALDAFFIEKLSENDPYMWICQQMLLEINTVWVFIKIMSIPDKTK